jgi:hypothetical protein
LYGYRCAICGSGLRAPKGKPEVQRCTPISLILSHIVYGAILGAFYHLK